ncbi:MAG TPA: hypothetical protein PLI54_05025 [Methanoculleus sp.]|nr:hypothetical protein [Methanoculleus sp.]
MLEKYPDNRGAALALDALNDLIGERDEALIALESLAMLSESSINMLRRARQLMLSGKTEEAEGLLLEITRMRTAGSVPRELHIMLAFARLGDREAFARIWHDLIERDGLLEPVPAEEFIKYPGDYTLLGEFPFREQIESLEYLFSYGVQENREAEVFAFIRSLPDYLESLSIRVDLEEREYGISGCFAALPVIKAIAEGSLDVVEKILSTYDPISDERLLEETGENIERIRKSGVEAGVLNELLRWSVDPVQPAGKLLDTLRRHTGGDDEPILAMFDMANMGVSGVAVGELASLLLEAHPDNRCLIESVYGSLKSEERYDEALAFADRHEFLKQDDAQFESLKLEALRSSDEEAAFQFLLGEIKERRMLERYADLFELALALDRMDEVASLRWIFAEEKGAIAGSHMLNALDRLKKRDVKEGMALFERSKRSGFPEELALMFLARSLLSAGYPKRVVGLREKMLKTSLPPEEIYPLLIRAYRELGRESEARDVEAMLEAVR